MREENLLAALRETFETAARSESATQHSRQTDDCLPLAHFVIAMEKGLSAEEMAHVRDCLFCLKTLIMAWRLQCPSFVTLADYRNGSLPYGYAVQEHLSECEKCRERVDSPLLRALAATAGALAVWTKLPALVGDCASSDSNDAVWRPALLADEKQQELSLALQEQGGRLIGLIETDDTTRAGQRLRIELMDAKGQVVERAERQLKRDSYGCTARIDFGPFKERLCQLGPECALVVLRGETGSDNG